MVLLMLLIKRVLEKEQVVQFFEVQERLLVVARVSQRLHEHPTHLEFVRRFSTRMSAFLDSVMRAVRVALLSMEHDAGLDVRELLFQMGLLELVVDLPPGVLGTDAWLLVCGLVFDAT